MNFSPDAMRSLTVKDKPLNLGLIVLILFPFYFSYDLYSGKSFYSHGDYPGIYFPFRSWFLDCLLNFKFPLWNPYWGAGHEAVVWATVPIDLYSLLDLFIRPHYEFYFPIHCMLIVLSGYCLFRKWGLEYWSASAIALLFFMSPLISYWSFAFINTNTFISHMFVFYFMVKWFETQRPQYVLLMGWVFFLGMFGTKLEFWFFEGFFFGFVSMIAFFLFQPRKPSSIFFVWAAILTAIIAQAWQINLLVNALSNANRLAIPHGLHNLFSRELYHNLLLSLGDTELFPVTLIGIMLFAGLNITSSRRWYFLVSGILAAFYFKFWTFYFLHSFIISPVFFGAFIASLLITRAPSKKHLFSTWVLFLLPAYYWCSKLENFDEAWMLKIAPVLFKLVWGFLVWLGCFQIHRYRVVQLAYLSVLMVLFLENQGQIILTYLLGIVWIGGRDTYLMEFSFILVAAFGITTYFRFKSLLIRMMPFIIIFSSFPNPLYTLPSEPVPGYANPLLVKGLSYNPYTGVPALREAFQEWERKPYSRGLAPDHIPLNQGTFLLEQTGNAMFYGSMLPARYHDLINYHKYDIKPEDHVAGYPSVFSDKTISRLPKTNTKGFTNGMVYYFTVWTIPPLKLDLLRMLGIERVFTNESTLTDPKLIESLNLVDLKNGEYKSATLANVLPRTFVVSNVTSERLKDFQENMRPQIEMIGNKDLTASVYMAQPAEIIKYEPEYVAIEAQSGGGYLVLTDSFHPYWTARVDGQPAEIIPAFHAFRAVKVPPGAHTIEFYCSVPNFRLTVIVSFATVILGLIGTLYVFKSCKTDIPSMFERKRQN